MAKHWLPHTRRSSPQLKAPPPPPPHPTPARAPNAPAVAKTQPPAPRGPVVSARTPDGQRFSAIRALPGQPSGPRAARVSLVRGVLRQEARRVVGGRRRGSEPITTTGLPGAWPLATAAGRWPPTAGRWPLGLGSTGVGSGDWGLGWALALVQARRPVLIQQHPTRRSASAARQAPITARQAPIWALPGQPSGPRAARVSLVWGFFDRRHGGWFVVGGRRRGSGPEPITTTGLPGAWPLAPAAGRWPPAAGRWPLGLPGAHWCGVWGLGTGVGFGFGASASTAPRFNTAALHTAQCQCPRRWR
jgi:hypothetical protein